MNVRSLFEGRNKRNPDLNPYTSNDDERLSWLTNDFLNYLSDWKESVNNRGNFSASEKASMLLNQQTLNGLHISVKSIAECIKILVNEGAEFVFTHRFNQDPLEQHFSHYRHKGGANNNPTVYDVRNLMTQLRAVGAQEINPKKGNTTNENCDINVIDNTKLPRRK